MLTVERTEYCHDVIWACVLNETSASTLFICYFHWFVPLHCFYSICWNFVFTFVSCVLQSLRNNIVICLHFSTEFPQAKFSKRWVKVKHIYLLVWAIVNDASECQREQDRVPAEYLRCWCFLRFLWIDKRMTVLYATVSLLSDGSDDVKQIVLNAKAINQLLYELKLIANLKQERVEQKSW